MKQSVSYPRIALALFALAVTAGPAAFRANADEWNKRTILTVNQTIQVKDTVLEPGQYVMQLLNSASDRHVVQIFNADQSRLINTILAIPKERAQVTGDSQFTFWETPSGTAKAMRAWFYPGDAIGQEFPYPKSPHLLAMLENPAPSPSPTPTPSAAMTQPAPPTSGTEQTAEEPTPTTETAPDQAAAPAQTPPPTVPPAAEQTPTGSADRASQPEPSQPEELPKTGSRYPLLGISGVALLALAGLLRLKRPGLQ